MTDDAQRINQLLTDNAALKEENAILDNRCKELLEERVKLLDRTLHEIPQLQTQLTATKAELEQVRAERDDYRKELSCIHVFLKQARVLDPVEGLVVRCREAAEWAERILSKWIKATLASPQTEQQEG